MWPGTFGKVTVMVDGSERSSGSSTAHHGKKDKTRGPFRNHRDYEWKMTGSVDGWDIEELS
ncbi:2244_t:CDS:2 [Entrophospora sp. SA101]|nr:2244_t:CDS:2 [Entrophospora sp. SA101]CAJ0833408.1 7667_t:CDS:2 [Entrophospora sp. SA101]